MGIVIPSEKKEDNFTYSTTNRLVVRADLQLYRNRTLTYLVPSLRKYGKEFGDYFNSQSWRAFGINDLDYKGSLHDGEAIFGLFKTFPNKSINFLDYLIAQPFYIDDYIFSIQDRLHMVVIQNPFPENIDKFKKGSYSKMYSEEDINRFFLKSVKINGIEKYTKVYSVLKKRKDYFPEFKDTLKREFGTVIEELSDNLEFDFTPILGEEIFNYDESSPFHEGVFNQKKILDNALYVNS